MTFDIAVSNVYFGMMTYVAQAYTDLSGIVRLKFS